VIAGASVACTIAERAPCTGPASITRACTCRLPDSDERDHECLIGRSFRCIEICDRRELRSRTKADLGHVTLIRCQAPGGARAAGVAARQLCRAAKIVQRVVARILRGGRNPARAGGGFGIYARLPLAHACEFVARRPSREP